MPQYHQSIKAGAVVTRFPEIIDSITSVRPELRLCTYDTFNLDKLARTNLDIIFVDLDILEDACGKSKLSVYRTEISRISKSLRHAPIVALCRHADERDALRAVKAGIDDYLTLPANDQRIAVVLDDIEENLLVESEVVYLRDQVLETDIPDFFKCADQKMQKIYGQVKRVAQTNSTVLITGETGTGKTLLAQQIHLLGPRKDGPFISIHCGAIPETLLESELFGHEKGAFTGALKQKLGKFDIARGGTIFLDEVGTIPPTTQIKLLQVLQDQTFSRIGGEEVLQADVRIIAATNDELLELTKDGRFRQDLYFRLNVFPIHLPPLRERLDDIPLVVHGIIDKLAAKVNTSIDGISLDVMQAFKNYEWPGNIRELENLIERALILEDGHVLTAEGFPAELFSPCNDAFPMPLMQGTLHDVRQTAIDRLEKRYLADLLKKHNGKVSPVAEEAGLGIRQINKLIQRHNLSRS